MPALEAGHSASLGLLAPWFLLGSPGLGLMFTEIGTWKQLKYCVTFVSRVLCVPAAVCGRHAVGVLAQSQGDVPLSTRQ